LAEALLMARDALLMVLDVYKDEGLPIPLPSAPLQIQAEGRQFVSEIDVEFR
jgi:predicted RNase H-like HicB family nuclease